MKRCILIFLFALLCCVDGTNSEVREPVVAGMFYPADSAELAGMIQDHLENVTDLPLIDGQLIALIVPHAGLVYSGPVAAHAYKLLQHRGIEKVVLCGPSHRFGFRGISVYGPGVSWKTPLGAVPCDDGLCRRLADHDESIAIVKQAHTSEHSLEVQLPYLQTVCSNLEIVPVVMGFQNHATIQLLARALASLPWDSTTVMVASTDWQHYRPASEGWKMDSAGLACLEDFDTDRLEKLLENGAVEACGGGPAAAVLRAAAAQGANRVTILRYGDSGDLTGDKSSVVGYAAAAVYRSADEKTEESGAESSSNQTGEDKASLAQLSDIEKIELLTIARRSIRSYLTSGVAPELNVSGVLAQPGAAFVTLEQHGRLRGCIGHTVAVEPLYKTVSQCAIQAAVSDPRFSPVRSAELPDLDIEISVLTPLEEVESLKEIEVGRDGLMIFMGNNRGLLLPQVATDYGWNRTEFLEQTCRKAGLPKDAYKSPGATIYRFQAVVFGEEQLIRR